MSEAHKDTGYSKEPNSETTQKIKNILAAKKPSNPAREVEYRPPAAEEKAAAKKGLVEARKALADAQKRVEDRIKP